MLRRSTDWSVARHHTPEHQQGRTAGAPGKVALLRQMSRPGPCRLLVPLLLLLLVALPAGCGGKKREESLAEQFEAAMKEPNPDTKAKMLVDVAEKQVKSGAYNAADRAFAEATKAARQIESPAGRANRFNAIALAAARSNRISEAKEALTEVGRAVGQIDDPQSQAPEFAKVALIYAKYLNEESRARSFLSQAESIIRGVEDPVVQANLYAKVAGEAHEMGFDDKARRLVQTVRETIERIETPRGRVDALVSLSQKLMQMDRKEEGIRHLMEAAEQAESMGEGDSASAANKVHAISSVATNLAKAGEKERAMQLVQQGEETLKKIADKGFRREANSVLVAAEKAAR